MTDSSSTPPPAYQPAPTPPPSAFPPMPKNPGAAMGMASGFFTSTSPSSLVTFAVVLFVIGALIDLIGGFFSVAVLSNILRFISSLCDQLGIVLLLVGAARFVADAFRSR